jgi:holo-[acyl-carrier protein] synthase
MALFGIGIDLIDVARFDKKLAEHAGLQDDLFSPREILYCRAKRHHALHFAARFAAKEAFMKALGRGLQDGLKFSEIEISNDDYGRPMLGLYGAAKVAADRAGIINIYVSLSHVKDAATALIVLET